MRYLCAKVVFYFLRYRYLFVGEKAGWYDVAKKKLELGQDPCHKNDGKFGMLVSECRWRKLFYFILDSYSGLSQKTVLCLGGIWRREEFRGFLNFG